MNPICNGSPHQITRETVEYPHPHCLSHPEAPGVPHSEKLTLQRVEILTLHGQGQRLLHPLKPFPSGLLLCHLALVPLPLPNQHPHLKVLPQGAPLLRTPCPEARRLPPFLELHHLPHSRSVRRRCDLLTYTGARQMSRFQVALAPPTCTITRTRKLTLRY
jgi:hypothetical protein